MESWRPKNLILILAREFASKLAIPMVMIDADANVVFFNEPAEELLGTSFAEAAQLSEPEWERLMRACDLDGNPLSLAQMPVGVALHEMRPVHLSFTLNERLVDATAFPLLASRTELVGAVALFWERNGAGGHPR